jgi:ethanolamine utilization protein EutA
MADLTVYLIEGTSHPLGDKLMLTAPTPISGKGTILFFSGGIGHYFYEPIAINSVAEACVHGDVGPLLAESIRQHPVIQSYTVRRPPETMHATVMGASSQTVTLSGSTIWAEAEILPIRNVPVVRPQWPAIPPTRPQVMQAVQQAVTRWDINPAESQFALALELTWKLNFESLTELAAGLADFANNQLPIANPLIIIIEHDYARALGQTVKTLLPRQPLLVVDQVGLQEGDYIDIGRPLLDGRVVPLSVKTLIFYH